VFQNHRFPPRRPGAALTRRYLAARLGKRTTKQKPKHEKQEGKKKENPKEVQSHGKQEIP